MIFLRTSEKTGEFQLLLLNYSFQTPLIISAECHMLLFQCSKTHDGSEKPNEHILKKC